MMTDEQRKETIDHILTYVVCISYKYNTRIDRYCFDKFIVHFSDSNKNEACRIGVSLKEHTAKLNVRVLFCEVFFENMSDALMVLEYQRQIVDLVYKIKQEFKHLL